MCYLLLSRSCYISSSCYIMILRHHDLGMSRYPDIDILTSCNITATWFPPNQYCDILYIYYLLYIIYEIYFPVGSHLVPTKSDEQRHCHRCLWQPGELLFFFFKWTTFTFKIVILSRMMTRTKIIPAFPQLGIALGFVLPAIIVRDQVMEKKNMQSSTIVVFCIV